MEHAPSLNTILLNVGVQALNLILFFLLFKYLLGDKIIQALQERTTLVKKLQHADQEYQTIVANAQASAHEIIQDAQGTKKLLIDEATQLAQQKADALLDEATNKAKSIISTAQVQTANLESDLKSNYEIMVKTTAWKFVQKIFDHDSDLQKAYLEKVDTITIS